MLTQETKKRIYLGLLIAAVIIGALFIIFAVFLNRGTLTIVAPPPYLLDIDSLKNKVCTTKTCSVPLAPGDYVITLKKDGYRAEKKLINIPIGGEHKEEITFQFIPLFSQLGEEKELKIFTLPTFKDADLSKQNIFYSNDALAYISRDPETFRQTLYLHSLQDGTLRTKTAVTSFSRDPKNYQLMLDVKDRKKIAFIDNFDNHSTLYFIDLEAKTRTSILEFPQIKNFQWIPGTEDFLVEAVPERELESVLFLYRAESKTPTRLDLKTPLKNIAMVDKNHLIAATAQSVSSTGDPAALEGELVTFGKPSAGINLVDFSLINLQSRLLKNLPTLTLPDQVKLNADQTALHFLIKDKIYQLQIVSQ